MTTTASKTASIYKPGTLHQVPPGTLLLERNIRDAQPDDHLVASVRDLGVLEPITAVLTDAGQLLVRFGHRRTLAAVAAERDTVPVYVTAADDTADQAEISRVIAQHDENTHRAGLTAGDEVHVVEQLVAFGLSADDIATQARIAKDRVDVALTVSRSKLASKAAVKYSELSLDQVAAIAEFDDDAEVAKGLIVTAIEDPESFAHSLQQRRDDRDRAAAHAAAVEELADAGVKVLDERLSYENRLDYLVDANGKNITEKAHAKCPGHAALVQVHMAWVAGSSDARAPRVDVSYYCTNPKKNGHSNRYGSSSSSSTTAADMTDAEREKAKAARRLVIDNNKAWDSAEAVRREWVAEFARRKTAPPKGTAAFIAIALADPELLDRAASRRAADWLGVKYSSTYDRANFTTILASASEPRALHIALIQVLAGYETYANRMWWRENGKTSRAGRYLRFLESAGYTLSDVEKYACSSKTV